jgi:hypothetical protein
MIGEIQALVECENKEIAAKADEVCMLHAAYEEGNITKEMYVELLEDVKNTYSIKANGDDMKFNSMLVAGVCGILQVI